MLNSFVYSLPEDLSRAADKTIDDWRSSGKIDRIWAKDPSVWTASDESKWLGWLDIAARELGRIDEYTEFSSDTRNFSDVVLLGMGGSSLCPEVLSMVFQKDRFQVLDSTVPAQVAALERSINLEEALFIVASKSGSTLEPNCFKQYFFDRMEMAVGAEQAGRHFAAITDPGSKLQEVAERDGFRKVFYGEPEIGGRFSALSVFGMAAAAAMRIDVKAFLTRAGEMADACRGSDVKDNPGALLGVLLGTGFRLGRDKLEIIASPTVVPLGAWLEQLIAESTGKQGKAIIPFDRGGSHENISAGDDRIYVHLRFAGDDVSAAEEILDGVASKGAPVIRIDINERIDLGQEFFRWEFATAVAGALLEIDPFDQPDVESAKIAARKITEEYESTGRLPEEEPFIEDDGFQLFTNESNRSALTFSPGGSQAAEDVIRDHISRIKPCDYFALLAYVEMSRENIETLEKVRSSVAKSSGAAASLQFGPRFLHSTGQAFKGGPNSGVFLQITSDDAMDLKVPGQQYTFGVVKAAQARGDFQVLLERGRRALRVHLLGDTAAGLRKLAGLFG